MMSKVRRLLLLIVVAIALADEPFLVLFLGWGFVMSTFLGTVLALVIGVVIGFVGGLFFAYKHRKRIK